MVQQIWCMCLTCRQQLVPLHRKAQQLLAAEGSSQGGSGYGWDANRQT